MLIGFNDGEDCSKHWLFRFLKPGFRHVFCAVKSQGVWPVFDPGIGTPELKSYAPMEFDLKNYWEDEGCTVVEIVPGNDMPRSPAIQSNCVGLVKAIARIRNPWAVTPYQLYRSLKVKS